MDYARDSELLFGSTETQNKLLGELATLKSELEAERQSHHSSEAALHAQAIEAEQKKSKAVAAGAEASKNLESAQKDLRGNCSFIFVLLL